jgi:undecaprenyl diphosphate synthase
MPPFLEGYFALQSDEAPTPFHVAIIMDGNGRWGLRQGRSRCDGHRAGTEAVRRTVEAAPDLGITTLTLFAFAQANWRRPAAEVEALMALFRDYLESDAQRLIEGGARLTMLGRRDRLPADLQRAVAQIEADTALNDRLNLRIALDYSSREAILDAAARLGPTGSADDLDRLIAGAPEIGAVDLMIRTGGEQRLSDFMLWECAFAELWFTDVMWPAFDAKELGRAVSDFQLRQRRFGALPTAANCVLLPLREKVSAELTDEGSMDARRVALR